MLRHEVPWSNHEPAFHISWKCSMIIRWKLNYEAENLTPSVLLYFNSEYCACFGSISFLNRNCILIALIRQNDIKWFVSCNDKCTPLQMYVVFLNCNLIINNLMVNYYTFYVCCCCINVFHGYNCTFDIVLKWRVVHPHSVIAYRQLHEHLHVHIHTL